MLTIVGFALFLIPVQGTITVGSGDLARIGWFSNNRYGNRKPNLVFRPSLVTLAGSLDRHYDVVVVGDSFSADLEKSWPNYLAAMGLSVLVVGVADDLTKKSGSAETVENQINSIIQSPTFKETPPSVLIFETIERFLKRRLVKDGMPCTVQANSKVTGSVAIETGNSFSEPPTLTYSPAPEHEKAEVRLPTSGSFDAQQLTYARDFLIKYVATRFGRQFKKVRELQLNHPRFSSERSKALLIVYEDLHKEHWNTRDIEEIQCQLVKFQQAVQSNGKTLFVALPIPDKLSAYHDDLVDPTPPRGVIDQLNGPSLNRPPLEQAIRAEIEAGEIDIYLPNDTHFGARGHSLTAETVIRFIEGRTRKVAAHSTESPRLQ